MTRRGQHRQHTNPKKASSPSDQPEPERSRAKTVRPRGSSTCSVSEASKRDEQLPCKYTTQGNFLFS